MVGRVRDAVAARQAQPTDPRAMPPSPVNLNLPTIQGGGRPPPPQYAGATQVQALPSPGTFQGGPAAGKPVPGTIDPRAMPPQDYGATTNPVMGPGTTPQFRGINKPMLDPRSMPPMATTTNGPGSPARGGFNPMQRQMMQSQMLRRGMPRGGRGGMRPAPNPGGSRMPRGRRGGRSMY